MDITDEIVETPEVAAAGGIDPVQISPTVPEERSIGDKVARVAEATLGNFNEAKRTIELTFGSEFIGTRWFGLEKLEMTPKAGDLKRLNRGGALLLEHDRNKHIGVVERAWIGKDRRAHAVVRFSKKTIAEEAFRDVETGILTNVSFLYRILEYTTTKGTAGAPDTITATRWEALEVSLLAIPFDPTVGVGRAADSIQDDFTPETVIDETREETPAGTAENKRGSNTQMIDEKTGLEIVAPATVSDPVFTREAEIMAFGRQFGADQRVVNRVALDPAGTVEMLRTILQGQYAGADPLSATPEQPVTELGLTEKQTRSYSMSRAILAQADGNWKGAEFERECHDEIVARGVEQKAGGFFVPNEVQTLQRDLSVAGGVATGGALVGTDHMPQSFIEILRSKMKMLELGVKVMSGLVGNPSIPRQDGAATGYWVNEGAAPTESQQIFAQLGLNPKTCGAVTEFTRQLLLQSAPSVDMLVMTDIAAVLARTVDTAIISGTGTLGQPTGILNTTGVTETNMAGANFTYADAVNFESLIAEANAPDSVGWLMRPSVRGTLKTTPKLGSTFPIYLLGDDGKMNGYPAHATTQMPAATLLYGDFSTVILGEWGILEIESNRLGSGFRAGNIEVRGLHSVDVAVRYPQAIRKLTAFA